MTELETAYHDFRTRGGVVDLASRVKLLFTGADRVRYLNGQVTAKVTQSPAPKVTPACITTAKGRLCAVGFLHIGATGILLDADAAVAETLPPRMEKYIIADDVAMEVVTDSMTIVHLLGMDQSTLPEALRERVVPVTRFGWPGFDLLVPSRAELPAVWEQLTAQFPVLSDELVDLIRIERGVPRWGSELDADTLPAEAGLDATHIDFHKGCYIGQEVISRIKSVGHVNRSLAGFVREDGGPLPAPSAVFAEEAPEKEIGRIASATFSFALDRGIALGYLRRNAPAGKFFAVGEEGSKVPVTLHPLPFLS
jgi:folate-binding protein YgfZ